MGAWSVIPAVGTGFLPFVVTTPPIPVPLPVPYEATYTTVGGDGPVTTVLMEPELDVQVIGGAEAEADYGPAQPPSTSKITQLILRRTGVYSALLVDAVELMGGTEACATTPDSIISECATRPVSVFYREDEGIVHPARTMQVPIPLPLPWGLIAQLGPGDLIGFAGQWALGFSATMKAATHLARSQRLPLGLISVLAVQGVELDEDAFIEITEDGVLQANEEP